MLNWARRTEFGLLVSILLLPLGGDFLLNTTCALDITDRQRTAYGDRPEWQIQIDATSAMTGCGITMYDIEDDYTAAGRWALAGFGLVGALVYLRAVRRVVGRYWKGQYKPLPDTGQIIGIFLALLVIAMLAMGILAAARAQPMLDGMWHGLCAFCSLGWLTTDDPGVRIGAVIVAFIGALGWPVWLVWRLWPGAWRGIVAAIVGYFAFLAISAACVTALEIPRGTARGAPPQGDLRDAPPGERYARSLLLVSSAATYGAPTEDLGDRHVSEGTRAILAWVVVVGAFGGAAGGGITWVVLLLAARLPASPFRAKSRMTLDVDFDRLRAASLTLVLVVAKLAIIGALVLLFIETWIGSPFQRPATLAEALQDATSAVGGAAVTSGLVERVTSTNLSSGLRESVDHYQHGMRWLMLLMVIGRLAPVLVLGVCAPRRIQDTAAP